MSYWETVLPTYLESWPSELARLSFATTLLRLTAEECEHLLHAYYAREYGDEERAAKLDPHVLNGLAQRLHRSMDLFAAGVFVRLGSRSPKDCYRAHEERYHCKSGTQAVEWLTTSERVSDDLQMALRQGYLPYLALREYKRIPAQEEFRLFVKGHRIVAASQYDYFQHFEGLAAEEGSLRWAIDVFFRQHLRDALHVDPVIADVWVHRRPTEDGFMWSVKLVEINPYFDLTDPCLFDWRKEPEWSQADPYQMRFQGATQKPDYGALLQDKRAAMEGA